MNPADRSMPERVVVHDQCNEWTRYSANEPSDAWLTGGTAYHREDTCAETKAKLREKIAAMRLRQALERAERAEARATAATDALSSLIDWTRRYIEAHPSAQGASYGTILHDSEATLRALLAAENKPENPKRPEEKCSPCGEAQYHNPAACFCPCHRPEEGMSVKNLTEAVALIEAELPGWLWEFSNITNEAHAMRPFGTGVSLLLRPADDAVRVWDKEKQDALVLAGRAIERARRRMSGEVGA